VLALFKKISPVVIQTPAVEAFGNCAEELYWGLLRARRDKKKVLFIFIWDLFGPFVFSKKGLGVNRSLKNIESPYRALSEKNVAVIILTGILTLIYCSMRLLGLIVLKLRGLERPEHNSHNQLGIIQSLTKLCGVKPVLGRSAVWASNNGDGDWKNNTNYWMDTVNQPLNVNLSAQDEKLGKVLATDMGLPLNEKFVCLHVRESGFYGANEGRGKTSRNGSITNYISAVQYLTQRGYWVIRLGDPSMTALPEIRNVIDYPFTAFKCDLLDLWLIKNCTFYIGHDSGPMFVAVLFEKQILSTNIVDFCFGYPFHNGDLGIVKHAYSKVEGRFLSLRETIDQYLIKHNHFINDVSIEFLENTPEEILGLVKEFLDRDKTLLSESYSSKLQTAVKEQRRNLRVTADWLSRLAGAERNRLIATYCALNGQISQGYLEDNYWEDSLNNR